MFVYHKIDENVSPMFSLACTHKQKTLLFLSKKGVKLNAHGWIV